MNRMIIPALIILLNTSCRKAVEYDMNEYLELNNNWSFRMEGESEWLPANVPGCVHTDLLSNERIPQPFYRTNEKELQWIDKKDWTYQCTFYIDSVRLQHNQILIRFEGLDTYSEIFINNRLVLETDNMFRDYKTDIKDFLVAGENILTVKFLSPIKIGLQKLENLGYGLPAVNDLSDIGGLGDKKVSVFTRKAPYHYGWDWGPRFVTSGIWRPVTLMFANDARIEDMYYRQSLVNEKEAVVDAVVEIDVITAGQYRISISSGDNAENKASAEFDLEKGLNSITLPLRIPKPDLWWPNGMGQQNRYRFTAQISAGNRIIDTTSHLIGLRSVELIREPDSEGKSFYFRVNGRNMFAKGANYIPNDNFLNMVTPEKYEYIISSAAESNMNMIRVWGGGIYENNILYELCDRYGILIWQDFMFACSMYPGDSEFLESVKEEVTGNVKRLRNYSSVALWCGNNEIDAAWCEGDMNCGWSWKQKYTPEQRKAIWKNYDTLFHRLIPDILNAYDPTRAYWPSSPLADWGQSASYSTRSGDMHYWGVWHGNEPFSNYYKFIGRFMSEYGFQSFPDMQSIRKFTLPHDWEIGSEVMLAHQRSGYGNGRIIEYMKNLYDVPVDFADQIYISQIMQAEAIKSAILAHRTNKPYCMGSLYWQLNDCWPVASWSGMDYYTSWKALQYFAKKAFSPVAVSFFPDVDTLKVFACSDLDTDKRMNVTCSIKDFTGKIFLEEQMELTLDHERSTEVVKFDLKKLIRNYPAGEIFLQVDLKDGATILASDIHFFTIPKNLKLSDPGLNAEFRTEADRIVIELSAQSLAKNVYLWVENNSLKFSDNYFDLLPGEKKIVTMQPGDRKISNDEVKIITLNSILKKAN